jgi:DinB family protein
MPMTRLDPVAPLGPREVANALRATLLAVRVECTGLTTAVLRWHPAPGEWCVPEILGHLIEAEERGFAGRVRTLLAETDPQFLTWDQDAVARERRDCERDLAGILAEWTRVREASATLVSALRPEDLARSGRHPGVGRLSISDLLAEWVHHDRNHHRQLLANVQAYVWPHMGNARRFSQPNA